MLESFMRPEERSILLIRRVPITSGPGPMLPESCVGLLVTEEIMVVMVRFDPVGREVVW